MLNDESRKIKLESIKIKMRRCPIDKKSIRFPDLVRQIAVNDTVYGWKFKLETRRDRPLDRTYDPTPFRLSRGRTPASSAPRLYIRPELFIVEGAERTRAPLINGEARHTRSRTTRGGGVGRVRTRVRTDIVSRWRIIWRSFSRRFLGVTHIHTHKDKRGVVTDLPRDVPSSRKFGGVSGKCDRCLNPLCQCSVRLLDSAMQFL